MLDSSAGEVRETFVRGTTHCRTLAFRRRPSFVKRRLTADEKEKGSGKPLLLYLHNDYADRSKNHEDEEEDIKS